MLHVWRLPNGSYELGVSLLLPVCELSANPWPALLVVAHGCLLWPLGRGLLLCPLRLVDRAAPHWLLRVCRCTSQM